ncbi:MAG: type II toxin-antitoxin system VapC family toxin [Thiobacillaceae bacterium]|nr:type II toxin-antitoxin system VapC family toxin [Thiobacillaceae bacterium]
MILYLDTSALVKLYVIEPDSDRVRAWVEASELVAVCRIAWAEACAAFARRAREMPADQGVLEQARQALGRDWPHCCIMELTQALMERACEYAEVFALRAYDGVQLAAAAALRDAVGGAVAFTCFDQRLDTSKNLLRGRMAALRGARMLAYLLDMSRILHSVRLALQPLATVFRGARLNKAARVLGLEVQPTR